MIVKFIIYFIRILSLFFGAGAESKPKNKVHLRLRVVKFIG